LGLPLSAHSAFNLDWTVGIGMDVLLGSDWVAQVQHRFADFGYPSGGFTFRGVQTCSGWASATNSPLTASYVFLVMQQIFELGFAYKFGPKCLSSRRWGGTKRSRRTLVSDLPFPNKIKIVARDVELLRLHPGDHHNRRVLHANHADPDGGWYEPGCLSGVDVIYATR
jgi:hypothetical protein